MAQNQVRQLSDLCDLHDIPVLAYGLRTDFQGKLFEGSEHLLAWADSLVEVKTICHCGRKATMVLRMDSKGQPIKEGRQIQIGGNDRYVSVCRKEFKDVFHGGKRVRLFDPAVREAEKDASQEDDSQGKLLK